MAWMGVVFGMLAIVFVILAFRKKQSTLPIEEGKVPLQKMDCGFRSDSFYMSYPLANLRIYEDFLVISSVVSQVIKFDEVRNCERLKVRQWGTRITKANGSSIIIWVGGRDLCEYLKMNNTTVSKP